MASLQPQTPRPGSARASEHYRTPVKQMRAAPAAPSHPYQGTPLHLRYLNNDDRVEGSTESGNVDFFSEYVWHSPGGAMSLIRRALEVMYREPRWPDDPLEYLRVYFAHMAVIESPNGEGNMVQSSTGELPQQEVKVSDCVHLPSTHKELARAVAHARSQVTSQDPEWLSIWDAEEAERLNREAEEEQAAFQEAEEARQREDEKLKAHERSARIRSLQRHAAEGKLTPEETVELERLLADEREANGVSGDQESQELEIHGGEDQEESGAPEGEGEEDMSSTLARIDAALRGEDPEDGKSHDDASKSSRALAQEEEMEEAAVAAAAVTAAEEEEVRKFEIAAAAQAMVEAQAREEAAKASGVAVGDWNPDHHPISFMRFRYYALHWLNASARTRWRRAAATRQEFQRQTMIHELSLLRACIPFRFPEVEDLPVVTGMGLHAFADSMQHIPASPGVASLAVETSEDLVARSLYLRGPEQPLDIPVTTVMAVALAPTTAALDHFNVGAIPHPLTRAPASIPRPNVDLGSLAEFDGGSDLAIHRIFLRERMLQVVEGLSALHGGERLHCPGETVFLAFSSREAGLRAIIDLQRLILAYNFRVNSNAAEMLSEDPTIGGAGLVGGALDATLRVAVTLEEGPLIRGPRVAVGQCMNRAAKVATSLAGSPSASESLMMLEAAGFAMELVHPEYPGECVAAVAPSLYRALEPDHPDLLGAIVATPFHFTDPSSPKSGELEYLEISVRPEEAPENAGLLVPPGATSHAVSAILRRSPPMDTAFSCLARACVSAAEDASGTRILREVEAAKDAAALESTPNAGVAMSSPELLHDSPSTKEGCRDALVAPSSVLAQREARVMGLRGDVDRLFQSDDGVVVTLALHNYDSLVAADPIVALRRTVLLHGAAAHVAENFGGFAVGAPASIVHVLFSQAVDAIVFSMQFMSHYRTLWNSQGVDRRNLPNTRVAAAMAMGKMYIIPASTTACGVPVLRSLQLASAYATPDTFLLDASVTPFLLKSPPIDGLTVSRVNELDAHTVAWVNPLTCAAATNLFTANLPDIVVAPEVAREHGIKERFAVPQD